MNRERRNSDHRGHDNWDRPSRFGGDSQPDYYSAPRRSAPSQDEEPGTPFTGTVKWFNPEKGYGFVEIPGGKDGFLHASVLTRGGHGNPSPGATIKGLVRNGEKATVTEVESVDESTAQAEVRATFQAKPPRENDRRDPAIDETIEATVKFYNQDKGYGFLEGASYDVFLHVSVLRRAGIEYVEPGDRFSVGVGHSDRGRVAVSVRQI